MAACLRRGALHGVRAWTMYGVAELLFLSVLSWVLLPGWILMPWHWRLTAYLVVSYAAAGAICGLGIGWILFFIRKSSAADEETRFNTWTSISVILAFALTQLFEPHKDEYTWFLLGSCGLMSAMVVAGNRLSRTSPWAAALTNPVISMFAFVGFSWLAKNLPGEHTRVFRLAVATLFLAASIVLARLLPRLKMRPLATVAFPGVVAAACVALTYASGKDNSAAAAGQANRSGKPNVLFIVLDTVRADHLSVYGYDRDTTPRLREFAQQSTVFTNAISASNMSLASHASLFTGLYPSEHGAHFDAPAHPWGAPLDPKFDTIAEIFKAHGYATFAVVSNYANVGHVLGLGQGFDSYEDSAPLPLLDWRRQPFLRNTVRRALRCCLSTAAFDTEYRDARDITNLAVNDLAGNRQGKPWLLFLNYMDAHWPLIPPAPFNTRYPGKDERITTDKLYELETDVLSLRSEVPGHIKKHLLSQYDGAIAYLDGELARLFDELKRMGVYDNTLIVITSDHGEAFGERNLLGHMASLYQDEVHVPLLIKFPNTAEPGRNDVPASAVDLLPTVMAAAGIPVPESMRGRNLHDPNPGKTPAIFSEAFPNQRYLDLHPSRFHRIERAIFASDSKLISSTAGQRELYNISKDPNELQNLCSQRPSECGGLESALQQWMQATLKFSPGSPRALPKDAVERLKSLGYIQ